MGATQKRSGIRNTGWTWAFGMGLVTVSLILALGSYHAEDPSFSSFSSAWRTPQNVLGYLGSWSADIFFQVLGYGAWAFPTLIFVALLRWLASSPKPQKILGARWWIGLSVLLVAYGLLADLMALRSPKDVFPAQGLLGIAVSAAAKPFFGSVGCYLLVAALAWCFCMIWWEELPAHLADGVMAIGTRFVPALGRFDFKKLWPAKLEATGLNFGWLKKKFAKTEKVSADTSEDLKIRLSQELRQDVKTRGSAADDASHLDDAEQENLDEPEAVSAATSQNPVIRQPKAAEPLPAASRPAKSAQPRNNPVHWDLPPMSLLETVKRKVKGPTHDQLIETAKKITSALKSFEVDGEVVEITPGPIITMYEFQPASGVRVQKIIAASTDLAMTLGAPSVRIVAPIPGKSVAGIEVPNADKEDVVLRDVFELTTERSRSMRLPLVMGKDSTGAPICEDLSRMPHLLIGGATSMGKSVLVNSILTGLMCRFTPEELRLIIVDPKLVEFKVFEDIPHLLLPIVNDPHDASQALKWAVAETKRRYVLMQKYSAKNLESYNQKISELKESDFKEGDKRPERFPYIVIVIDELAELMLTAKKDVEQSIVRLTQLARAAGLHLIMATQRPSADVVTGLIKSNCPSRAALRVASNSDSRIILDCTGAEQLIGRGDMFFTNTGPMGLRRMQSAFVSDGEIEKICDFWRSQGEPEYKEEILAPDISELQENNLEAGEVDSIYGDVLEFAREKGKISTSLIQRRFQIGYSRAARIMEQLESNGVVGEQAAAGKPRDVIL